MKLSKALKYKFRDVKASINTFFIKSRRHAYDAFGCYDLNSSVPVFVVARKNHGVKKEKYVYAYSPKLLAHCVHNLTDEAKLEEAAYLDDFVFKCKYCAKKSKIRRNKKEWNYTIDDLCNYLFEFKKENEAKLLDGEEPEK